VLRPARGAVLLLEEIGEATYRIDRMLTQLRQAGAFDGLSGVLLGSFDVPERRRFPPDRRPLDVLREFFEPLGVPVVRNVPVGHRRKMRAVPLGERVRVDTPGGRIDFRR
jgi:muramoyltetrapeptide carboxypeptidase